MTRIEQLQNFLKTDPNDVFSLYALALENIKINEEQTAIILLKKVITLNADYVAAYYQLGQVLERVDSTEAAVIYQKGIETATRIKNNHAKAELMSAYNLLTNDY